MLGNWHMRPRAVASGPAALAELQRAVDAGEPYALVLLDAMMPDMDGFTLAEEIKQRPRIAGATIMMLSSADRQLTTHKKEHLGIAMFLLKPVKQSELSDAIMTAMGERAQEMPAAPPAAAASGPGLSVLLAEDNAVNQRLIVRLLEKQGHKMVVVGNGLEALAALDQQSFDLVLMDVQMPEMGGFEATAAIRQREKAAGVHVPIIAMTAHAMKGDRERCLEAGMDAYISKPVQAQELFETIGRTVASCQESRPTTPVVRDAVRAVNWDKALEKVAGDRELLRELIAIFLEEWPRWRAELDAAVSARNGPLLKRLAHTVKGALAQFELKRVQDLAQELEHLGGQADPTGVQELCGALVKEVELLCPALSAFLS
jgi:CheY-like chemotaxis protein